jgi:transcription elongation GreA/GreB family factor
MSRAFVKDLDDAEAAPILPVHEDPRPITRQGRAELLRRLAHTSDPIARAELEHRIGMTVVQDPPADRRTAGFGATVTVRGAADQDQRFTIVGPDEIDIANRRIGIDSPLAAALMGRRVGNQVTWRRPAGDRKLTILAIDYDADGEAASP